MTRLATHQPAPPLRSITVRDLHSEHLDFLSRWSATLEVLTLSGKRMSARSLGQLRRLRKLSVDAITLSDLDELAGLPQLCALHVYLRGSIAQTNLHALIRLSGRTRIEVEINENENRGARKDLEGISGIENFQIKYSGIARANRHD